MVGHLTDSLQLRSAVVAAELQRRVENEQEVGGGEEEGSLLVGVGLRQKWKERYPSQREQTSVNLNRGNLAHMKHSW